MKDNVTTSTHKTVASYESKTPCTRLELPQNTQREEHTAHSPLNTTETES